MVGGLICDRATSSRASRRKPARQPIARTSTPLGLPAIVSPRTLVLEASDSRYCGPVEQREQREQPVTMTTATDEERAEARARFRQKLATAEARMTPEKRAAVRAAFGLDASAA